MIIKPILWKKPRRDGKHNIKIYLYRSAKDKKYITTPHFVFPAEWDDIKWVKKVRANADMINADLRSKINALERASISEPTRTTRTINESKSGRLTLSEYVRQKIDQYDSASAINRKTGKLYTSGTKRTKKSFLNRLLRFFTKHHPYDWTEIDFTFYEKYLHYLRYEISKEGLNENTIGKTIQTFKEMMRRGMKEGHHTNTIYEDFPQWRVESDNIALTEDEIEAMMNAELNSEALEIERDRFYVSYNFFLRFTDSITIDERDIKKIGKAYYLDTVPGKTMNSVIVPLKPRTLEILKRHKFRFPPTSTQKSNLRLQTIGKKAGIREKVTTTEQRQCKLIKHVQPKYKLITTHTARRSAATNLYLSMVEEGNVDLKLICMMGGWKTTAQLETYLKIDKQTAGMRAQKHSFFNR